MLILSSRDLTLLANAALTEISDLDRLVAQDDSAARRHREAWQRDAKDLRSLLERLVEANSAKAEVTVVGDDIVDRMAKVMLETRANVGVCTDFDLIHAGFSEREIAEHGRKATARANALDEQRRAA